MSRILKIILRIRQFQSIVGKDYSNRLDKANEMNVNVDTIPLSNRDNWYNLWTNNFAIYKKKFYFFKETLYDWLNRLEFDFSILGE